MIYVPIVIVILISIVLGSAALNTSQNKTTLTPSPNADAPLPSIKPTSAGATTVTSTPTTAPYNQNIQPTGPQQTQQPTSVASPTTTIINNNYQAPLNIPSPTAYHVPIIYQVIPFIYQEPTITIAPVVIEADCSGVQDAIARIKSRSQSSIDNETLMFVNEMEKRGISSSSPDYQQALQGLLEPLYFDQEFLISDFCWKMRSINSCPCP